MSTDIASSYLADELSLDMNNSPITPTMDINDQFSGMMKNFYSPGAYAEDVASYDYFSFDDNTFDTKPPPNNDFMSWTTNAATTTNLATYAPPMPASSFGGYFGSPETEYLNDGFVSPAALGADTDSDSTSSGRKHSMDEQPAMIGSMSPPPTKKQCSTKTKTSSASPKSKPKEPKARSSKSGSTKSSPTGPASVASSTSSHGGNHNIQLRTASRKPKPTGQEARSTTGSVDEEYEEDDDALTNEERRARRNHNNVEKQYRNRLNQQFEKLLAVLPAADQRAAQGGKSGGKGGKGGSSAAPADGDDKRMSKAEVLDLARRRIRELEDQRSALQHERNGLLENVGRMQQQVMRQRVELASRA